MATLLCPYFGKCAGCTSQHIDYQLQLQNKQQWLAKAIKYDDIKVISNKNYFYRNRMDFIFYPRGIGLRTKSGSKSVIDIEECVISNKKINILLKEVRSFFTNNDLYGKFLKSNTFRYLVIRSTKNISSLSFVLSENSHRLAEAINYLNSFAVNSSADNILVTYTSAYEAKSTSSDSFIIKGSNQLYDTFLGKKFWFSAQGFFQNNSAMTEKMVHYSHDILQKYETKNAQLLDLYGGVGTFGIINADIFKSVLVIENNSLSIEAANKNIQENKTKNVAAKVLDAKQLRKVSLSQPLYVITDPPRSGMDIKVIQYLNQLKPKVILYISCNIQQLAKELSKFKEYEIKSAALFDLFPQTPHSEAVVELKLKPTL